jgi:hypothetical protein
MSEEGFPGTTEEINYTDDGNLGIWATKTEDGGTKFYFRWQEDRDLPVYSCDNKMVLSGHVSSQLLHLQLTTVFRIPKPDQAFREWNGVSWSVELAHGAHSGVLLSLTDTIGRIMIYIMDHEKS